MLAVEQKQTQPAGLTRIVAPTLDCKHWKAKSYDQQACRYEGLHLFAEVPRSCLTISLEQ